MSVPLSQITPGKTCQTEDGILLTVTDFGFTRHGVDLIQCVSILSGRLLDWPATYDVQRVVARYET